MIPTEQTELKDRPKLSETVIPRAEMVLVQTAPLSSIIELPDGFGGSDVYATVLRLGEGRYNRATGGFDPWDIEVGDVVLCDMAAARAGQPVEFRDERLHLVPHQMISAKLKR